MLVHATGTRFSVPYRIPLHASKRRATAAERARPRLLIPCLSALELTSEGFVTMVIASMRGMSSSRCTCLCEQMPSFATIAQVFCARSSTAIVAAIVTMHPRPCACLQLQE